MRRRDWPLGLSLFITALVSASGFAATGVGAQTVAYVVNSTALDGDIDGCETGGVCTWQAARSGATMSTGVPRNVTITFDPSVPVVTRGRFGALASDVVTVTLRGPVVIDMGPDPENLIQDIGLNFQNIDGVVVEDVWIVGTEVPPWPDTTVEGIRVTGFGGTCTIERVRITGVFTPLEMVDPIACHLIDNRIGLGLAGGIGPDEEVLGNGSALTVASGIEARGNVVVGAAAAGVDVIGDGATLIDNGVFLNGTGLLVRGDGNVVRSTEADGNVVGILISGDDNDVTGSRVGVDAGGAFSTVNFGDGMRITGDRNCIGALRGGGPCAIAGMPVIGDLNIVAGNDGHGISIGGRENTLVGAWVGVSPTAASIGNGGDCIHLEREFGAASDTVVRESVIGDCVGSGISIARRSAGHTIVGNHIGVLPDGSAVPNAVDGIAIDEGSNVVIGGPTEADRNFISHNRQAGVYVGPRSDGVTIQNSVLGLDPSGNAAPNHRGVRIAFDTSNVLLDGNFISGNRRDGIELIGTQGALISHNFIGFALTIAGFDAELGNGGHGASLVEGASNNVLSENVVVANAGHGVLVNGPTTVGNRLSLNSIHGNWRRSIENQAGGNGELAPPVFDTVDLTLIEGTFPGCKGCTIEIFSDDGFEAQIVEASDVVAPDGGFSLPGPFDGPAITCTLTNLDANTSELGCGIAPPTFTPMTVEKRAIPRDGFQAGGTFEYEIEVANISGVAFLDADTINEIEDALPDELTFVSGSIRVDGQPNDDDLADGIGYDADGHRVLWNGVLAGAASLLLSFEVEIDASLDDGTEIANQGHVLFTIDAVETEIAALPTDDPATPLVEDATVIVVPEPAGTLLGFVALVSNAALVVVRRRSTSRRSSRASGSCC